MIASAPPRLHRYLRIGLVGHRKLLPLATEQVEAGFAAAFGMISKAFAAADHALPADLAIPDPRELVLVTSLADGSDQIGAACFLDGPRGEARRFEAVLPFAREHFDAVIRREGGQSPLGLLQRADAVLELADHIPTDLSPDALAANAQERRRRELRYIAIGDVILRQSDLLLAVWNGEPGAGPGGTATTVALALREGVPVLRIDPASGALALLRRDRRYGDVLSTDVDDAFARDPDKRLKDILEGIIAGPLSRASHDQPASHGDAHDGHGGQGHDQRLKRYFGTAHERGEPAPTMRDHFAYDRLVRLLRARQTPTDWKPPTEATARPAAFAAVENAPEAAHFAAAGWGSVYNVPTFATNHLAQAADHYALAALPRIGTALVPAWAHADAAATWLSHAYRSAYVATFVFATLAVVIGLLGLLDKTSKWAFVLAEVGVLGVAIGFFVRARRDDRHTRYIDARHLAEQFRPAWILAQLGLIGRKVLGGRPPWTAYATQNIVGSIGLPADRLTPQRLVEIAAMIEERVVIEQMNYHLTNRARMGALHHALESIGFMALVLAPLVGVGYVVSVMLKEVAPDFAATLSGFLPFGVLMVAVWALFRRRMVPFEAGIAAVGVLTVAGLFIALGKVQAPSWATILMAALPALAAAVAGIRYQGDFERFSKRSDRTARELARIGAALATFRARSAPTFMELRDILTDLERVLLQDIEDWRYVYAERPSPEP